MLWNGADANALGQQFIAFAGFGSVGVVSIEHSDECRLEECVGAVNVVPVSGKMNDTGEHSTGREDEMFTNAVEVLVERSAIAVLRQTVQALFVSGALRTADIDRMGIDDEKGGWPSPDNWRNASESL